MTYQFTEITFTMIAPFLFPILGLIAVAGIGVFKGWF